MRSEISVINLLKIIYMKKEKPLTMGFDLDLATKNDDTADQTPTPTSFFRNCEEVGLFQDLQNVNPFEETFKKALESSEIKFLKLHDTSNEDTLHTPHILPVIEEPIHVNILDINNSRMSNVNLIEMPQITEKIYEVPVQTMTERTDSKNILKQVIIKKDKNKMNISENNSFLTKNNHRNTKVKYNKTNIERVREINRASQMKCRMRKKKQMYEMLDELTKLRKENEDLRKQNSFLKQSNDYLWKTIDGLGGSKKSISDKMREVLDTTVKARTAISLRKLPLLAPAGSKEIPIKSSAPIVVNLVPIQIVNTDTRSAAVNSPKSYVVKKERIVS